MIENCLICHPDTPCFAINDFHVEIEWDIEGNLHLRYQLCGNLALIEIPAPQSPAAVDGLWEHTCFEAFIAVENEHGYHEFNFAPSGQYAAYGFNSYRLRSEWILADAPRISFSKPNDCYQLQTSIAAADLPVNSTGKSFQLGLSAVIELQDGSLSYWALHHPSEHPDFHHRDGLTLSLNPCEFV
jgi:hypothetical protein